MTCDAMREALLVADLEELRGVGGSPVARHVQACASCRGDAERILALTSGLATSVRRRRSRRVMTTLVPLALAAGLGALLLLRSGSPSTAAPESRPQVAVAPPVRNAPPAPRRVASRQLSRSAPLPPAAPVLAIAYAPVPLAPSSVSGAPPAADPRSHKRSRVLPTSDPNITVLWSE